MKKLLLFCGLVLGSIAHFAQEKAMAYKDGEWLKYKMSYGGFLKAGTAEIRLKEVDFNGKKVFHAKGFGKTSEFISWFFRVRDTYESYFDVEKNIPYLFKRDVNEGDYTIRRDIKFNHDTNMASVKDYKFNSVKEVAFDNAQDLISCFYYLRRIDVNALKEAGETRLNLFFDSEVFSFKLRFLGSEVIKTKFGKIKTIKLQPIVQSGRVFKEGESVVVWVTDDRNKIPLRIKASLAVGSLTGELRAFDGLANPLKTIVLD